MLNAVKHRLAFAFLYSEELIELVDLRTDILASFLPFVPRRNLLGGEKVPSGSSEFREQHAIMDGKGDL